MEVYDAIRTILAVRQYQDKPIPEDAVGRKKFCKGLCWMVS